MNSGLPAAWSVPDAFRQRFGAQVGRQRHMVEGGHLLLILHAPPAPDEARRTGRFFWRSPDGQWTSKDLGTGPNALNSHLDQYETLISKLDRVQEEATTTEDLFQVLEHLAPVYRAARNMHNVLQEARKSCPEYREIIDFRDRAYEIERTAELLFNETKNSLDFAVAKRAEEQALASHRMAVAAHRLNLLAAFFFPIATLTAIFGVNLQHGWEEASPPYVFLGVIAVGLLSGAVLTALLMRPDPRR